MPPDGKLDASGSLDELLPENQTAAVGRRERVVFFSRDARGGWNQCVAVAPCRRRSS
jgi:hypothetical protein